MNAIVDHGTQLDAGLARAFMVAGKATFTVVSKKTGTRFTLCLTQPDDNATAPPNRRKPIWVSVLSGPDNQSMYSFLGTIWEESGTFTYGHGRRSRIDVDAPSAKAAQWIAQLLNHPELSAHCEIWHEGKCGRCGRKLTVPESIRTGIGPECARRGK